MSEASYQNKLIKQFEQDGWYVLKLVKTNKNGIPDLLLLKPNDVKFVEVKGAKGKLSKLQEYRIKELNQLNFKTEVSYEPGTTK